MAVKKHLQIVLQGDYVPSTLPGEIWENTLRCALVFGDIDDVGVLPENFEPVAATISITEPTYTVQGNWIVNGPLTNDFDPGSYLVDQVEPAVAAWVAAARLSNQVRLRAIEVRLIGTPFGKQVPAIPYATGTPCRLEYTSDYPIGSHSTTQLPPQNSVGVTHRTLQVGPRGRGRMFLPSGTVSLLSGARIQSSERDAIVAAQVDLLQGVALDGDPTEPHIRPIITGAPWTDYAVINRVEAGDVMDSQRRRRNALTEVRTTAPVTY